jgi:cation transport ATPase
MSDSAQVPVIDGGSSERGEETIQQSASAPVPEIEVTSAGPIPHRSNTTRANKPSWRSKFILAFVCVGLGALTGAMVQTGLGPQPGKLIQLLALLAATVLAFGEALSVAPKSLFLRDPFTTLPFIGTLLVVAASAMDFYDPAQAASVTSVMAPFLATATMLLGRGLTLRGRSLSRKDADFLFPSAQNGSKVLKGSRTTVKQGDVVPADCRVERGCLGVDERALTPIPTFRVREEGDVLYAGSEVLAGSAEVQALVNDHESNLRQLQDALAPMLESSAEGLVKEDSRAGRATAVTITFLAVAAAISWNERSADLQDSLVAAGMVALGAAICQISGLLHGMRREMVKRWTSAGLLLSSEDSVRTLSTVDSVVVDPSRISTGSRFAVTTLEVMDDRLATGALCDCLSSLLGRAEDPLLAAAGDYCRAHASRLSIERVLDLREYSGRGICGTVHGIELSVGNEDFLVERGIMVQPTDTELATEGADTMLLVAIDDDVVARFWLSTNQEYVVSDDSSLYGVPTKLSSGVAQELPATTLLVRGSESDLVGQMAKTDVSLFSPQAGEIRRATVVALTPEVSHIQRLIAECRSSCRLVDRTRVLVGFCGLALIASVFAGLLTPVVPLGLMLFLMASLRLS